MKLVKEIVIVCMNGGGWNATVPGGPWATDETPEKALARLLAGLENTGYRLALDNQEESLTWRQDASATDAASQEGRYHEGTITAEINR